MQICLHSSKSPVRSALFVLAALAALVLAACGDDSDSGSTDGPDPATVTPADAVVYMGATIRPEGDQKSDLDSALSKLLGDGDPGARITALLDEELSDEGLSYSEDVEPWLGQTAGLFFTDFSGDDGDGAAAIATTDGEAALAAVEKAQKGDELEDATYEGTSYKRDTEDDTAFGIVGDFLVSGTESGMKAAIDASASEALADDEAASSALADTPENSLFEVYVDTGRAIDLAVDGGIVDEKDLESAGAQLDELQEGPIVVSGGATADSMTIETSAPQGSDTADPTDIVSTLPSGSWLAVGAPMVGESIAAGYDSFVQALEASLAVQGGSIPGGAQDLSAIEPPDVRAEIKKQLGVDLSKDLGWMGDVGVFIQGGSLFSLGGGLVIETDDPDAATAALSKVARALAREPDVQVRRTADGFELQAGPAGADVSIGDDKVIVAIAGIGVDDVLSPSETLEGSESFEAASGALGDDLTPAMFVDFPTIIGLIESTGQTGSPEFQQAEPVLNALDYLIAGSGSSDDRAIGRLVLGVKDGGGSSDAPAASIAP